VVVIGLVVVPVVVPAAVVADVEVVMSAITVPENIPAHPRPSRKRPIAARRFTARAV
jgi:hypothetical protein